MPVHRGKTTKDGETRYYYQWGKSGKKYFFKPGHKASQRRAKAKAERQGRAIRASGYRG